MVKDSKERCGTSETQSGKPCRYTKPCPYHIQDGKKKPPKKKSLSMWRHERLVQERIKGRTLKEAALAAGYSKTTAASGKATQIWNSPSIQARIKRLKEAAQLQTEEVIGTIVDHMRFDLADLYPDDPFLQRAKELGVSHLIKRIKRRPVIAGFDQQGAPIMDNETEIEGYGSLEAAKHLTKVFGLEQLPAPNQKVQRDFDEAVKRVVQAALDAGSRQSPEQLRANAVERLRSLYPLVSDANN